MPTVPELDQLHLPELFDEPPVLDPDPPDDEVEVVEVRSPLTVLTWAGAAVAAGLVVMAVVLLLGPIFGPVVLLAVTVAIVRRYRQAEDLDEVDPAVHP